MRRHIAVCSLVLAGIAAAPLFSQENVPPPAKAFASATEILFNSMPNFLKLPSGLYLGEGIGVVWNSKEMFLFTREAASCFQAI